MRGRLPVFAHPCQRIGAAEARWAHNPKVLRSKLRFAILSLLSRLAQLVERKTLNLVVVGSSPTVGVLFAFFFFGLHLCEGGPVACVATVILHQCPA